MPIEKITLRGFRNHEETYMVFGPGINVIWGENGSGKTSILEAVHILSIGKSFKTNRISETVKHNSFGTKIEGGFTKNEETETISLKLTKDSGKQLKVNNTSVSAKEILGKNPVVLLSPEEQKITKGNPGERRSYFDRLFSTVSKKYLKTLSVYSRALKQRNATLKETQENKATLAWDKILSESGAMIWAKRKKLNEEFKECLDSVSKAYEKENVLIKLRSSERNDTPDELFLSLRSGLKKDLFTKTTSYGPHRDVYSFFFGERPLRGFGSEGEHKISLALIKLAEYTFIKGKTNRNPTLLLDDLFAKLDFERSDALLALLEKKSQTIITNTDLVDVEKHGIDLEDPNNKSFHLERRCRN